ncbi:MAG: hypothetical protein KDA32_04625 [Phycisphaerales bacterium]|nr:hypothetical protein [Phycisphaerales bacterium]
MRTSRNPLGVRGRAARWRIAALVAVSAFLPTAFGQIESDEPLLPQSISENDIVMEARIARQGHQGESILLQFDDGFVLTMGRRELSAARALVWIDPDLSEEGRKFYDLTVFLTGYARVKEPGGAITEDETLLVTNLRTYGRVTKRHDAVIDEPVDQWPLYEAAIAERERARERAEVFASPQVAEATTPAREAKERTGPARIIRYNLPILETAVTPGGEQVIVGSGRVYFSHAGGPNAATLEILADNAVVFPAEGASLRLVAPGAKPDRDSTAEGAADPTTGEPSPRPRFAPANEDNRPSVSVQSGLTPQMSSGIRGVYLEGDVVMAVGSRFVRAERLYYDFEREQALILDAVLHTEIPERNVPLYVRAEQIRQLSPNEFTADNARVTTSEFFTPSYHVGAERIVLRDVTPRDNAGRALAPLAGVYEMTNSTLNVENTPILYWPYSTGRLEQTETLIRRTRIGRSDTFGAEFETTWYLFPLLGVPTPPGVDGSFRLDYFTKRGPGTGVDLDYRRDDYFGLLRSYIISDDGKDNLGPFRDSEPDTTTRGRFLTRHRQYLPDDWELTLELSYASDPTFLEEYRKSEWFEGKEQETLLYLKRARDVEAITFLANWRLLDFVNQTEHLPEIVYRRIGDTFADPLVLYHESRIGGVRYRPDDRRLFDSNRYDNTSETDLTFRADVRQEAELPIKLDGLNVVPFATGRLSFWDSNAFDESSEFRNLGVVGVRGGTSFSRVFEDARSQLFDVSKLRHIVTPHFTAFAIGSNVAARDLTPFDQGVETLDPFYGGAVGVRQTWQTKRGAGDLRRTVDLFSLDLEVGAFGDTPGDTPVGWLNPIRPEDSRARNYFSGEMVYRMSDTTSLLYDFNYDLNDGAFDRHNLSVAVERLPRTAYIFGVRHAADIDLTLVGGGANYRVNERHIFAVRTWFDVERGELGELTIAYVRKLPRWYLAINVDIDEVFDDTKVTVSIWPEGIPEWTLGSRRFTGLATSTGIRP